MDTFNYNDMSRQDRIDILLSEIVLGQLETGHFEVVDAVNKFLVNLPRYVMDRANRACAVVAGVASQMTVEQCTALLTRERPILTIGQSTTFMELTLRWVEGCIGERLIASQQNMECAEQYCNLGLIVMDLAKALELPKQMQDALNTAHCNAVAYMMDLDAAIEREEAKKGER